MEWIAFIQRRQASKIGESDLFHFDKYISAL